MTVKYLGHVTERVTRFGIKAIEDIHFNTKDIFRLFGASGEPETQGKAQAMIARNWSAVELHWAAQRHQKKVNLSSSRVR